VISKEELLEEVWSDVFTTDGVLKKAVSQIRRALSDDADRSRYIATYHGRGYRFVAPVTRTPPNAGPTLDRPKPVESGPYINYDQLAGREAEMMTLRAELRSALDGNPRPVVLTGEAGVGKTQLTRHFRRWAVEQSAVSLYGRFFDYRGARLAPYELFIDLLRSAVTCDPGVSLADAIESATGIRLPAGLFTSSDPIATGGGSIGDQYRFIVPICRCFLALAKAQPLVVILDDVQWADPTSLDLIGCLMRSIESEPLMLVMLVRSDEADNPEHPIRTWLHEHASQRSYTTMRLERLDLDACRLVIGSIFRTRRGDEIPRSDIEDLHRLTNGNPYFLAETLRLLVTAKAIIPDPAKERWIWKGIRNLVLPETIVNAARAKIEALPQNVRSLVEQAAVIGDEFRVGTLCHVTRTEVASIEDLLSEAVRSDVLTIHGLSAGEDCRFEHSILRHVIYESIPPFRRRHLHARAAEALEIVYASEPDRIAEALAAHYWAAGEPRRAFEAGMRAWTAASRRSEWRKAAAVIERLQEAARVLEGAASLHDDERVSLLISAGDTYRSVGKFRDAASAIDRAAALADAAGDRRALARSFFIRGLIHIATSAYAEARSTLTQALDLFLQLEDRDAVSRTAVQLAVVSTAVGNYERTAMLIESLLAGDAAPDIIAEAHTILGWSEALMGRFDEAAALLTRSLDYHGRAGNLRERAMVLLRLHWVHLSHGEYETAIALAVRARADADTVGDLDAMARANMGIGQVRVSQGMYGEAISFLSRALDQLRQIGDAHCEAECLWQLGRARGEGGDIAEGMALLWRALDMVRKIGDRDDEFRILIDCARLCIAGGELDTAMNHAAAAGAIAEAIGNGGGAALAQREFTRAVVAQGARHTFGEDSTTRRRNAAAH
jgi:predicted ATPase